MKRPGLVIGLMLCLGLATQAALGASGDPQTKLTSAGTSRANAILLSRDDLGAGSWKTNPSPSSPSASCGIVSHVGPAESDLVEVGKASGPVFSNASSEALDQAVQVFATPGQANSAWLRTVNTKLVICMEEQVEATSSMGAPVSVTDWSRLKLPKLTVRSAGFRVTATATGSKSKVNVYFDEILLSRSSTVTRIVFSSFGRPFPLAFESRVARQVSNRLA